MSDGQNEFTLSYEYSPSQDGEERLARAYDLILEMILAVNQTPEEDAVGAFPNVADAGGAIHSAQDNIARPLGASHARR